MSMEQVDLNPALKDFLGSYYNVETAYDDDIEANRRYFGMVPPHRAKAIKDSFTELLKTRSLSTEDYEWVTEVEFETEDGLYRYLQGVYDYLFNGADTQPIPIANPETGAAI